MTTLVHQLISQSAQRTPQASALILQDQQLTYLELHHYLIQIAHSYLRLSVERHDRIAIYLPKTFENVGCMFAASLVDAVFVPINPVLKAPQAQHIIADCTVKVLMTTKVRFVSLLPYLTELPELTHVIITDKTDKADIDSLDCGHVSIGTWQDFLIGSEQFDLADFTGFSDVTERQLTPQNSANNIAAILYTSGSTGKPKGVMLSHQNMIVGAHSVSEYLHNVPEDRILALLPLSFDYGLSQLTTSFLVGARCVLLDYLLPNDVLKAIAKYQITGLAAVPPLWYQLAKLTWPKECGASIRYFTNSGGVLSLITVKQLQQVMVNAAPYLMYGLTEAFRSTFLAPSEIDTRPNSIGKAIPNAHIHVLRPDGSPCNADEVGELVHTGPLVTLGYWNDKKRTAQRFKPIADFPCLNADKITDTSPDINKNHHHKIMNKLAVFSGDMVKKDQDGYIYFVARNDDMIKTSGYRVSPAEIEEVLYQHSAITEVAVLGIAHNILGQAIIAIISSNENTPNALLERDILKHCQQQLANYMLPKKICLLEKLPHNANGKIDRNHLYLTYQGLFAAKISTNDKQDNPND